MYYTFAYFTYFSVYTSNINRIIYSLFLLLQNVVASCVSEFTVASFSGREFYVNHNIDLILLKKKHVGYNPPKDTYLPTLDTPFFNDLLVTLV